MKIGFVLLILGDPFFRVSRPGVCGAGSYGEKGNTDCRVRSWQFGPPGFINRGASGNQRGVGGEIEGGKPSGEEDRKSTRLNSSHIQKSRMPSSA